MKRNLVKALAVLFGVCCIGGCGQNGGETQQTGGGEPVREEDTTARELPTESSEKEGQEASDAVILVVSFGTSYNDNRDLTIGAIETAVADTFPDYEVRRAFTSQIIIDKLKERDGLSIDNVTEALDRAAADGVKELIVQPTHLMDGYEYNDIAAELTAYVDKFDKIILGEPLLTDDDNFDAVIEAITEKTASYDDGKTAICFMGHGTEADSNTVYPEMQEKLTAAGYENYYIGTVEAAPTLDDVLLALKEKGTYEKVVLEPLMVVAGDHANNDMAGEEEDSWKTILEGEGYEVECILEGLGQIPAIRDIYTQHLKDAIAEGTAFTGTADAGDKTETAAADEVTDGIYTVQVESDSSMFNIKKAELTIGDGSMSAVITLGGTGYSKLYMGTAEQASQAEESEFIPFEEDADGAYSYTIPVAALDEPMACAAFSKKKEEWYDRRITFLSSSLKAVSDGEAEGEKMAAGDRKTGDGTYTIELTFAGGSGKAEILSPATLMVAGDTVTATVQWNSSNYDYMIVGGEKYLPVSTEGGSVFEIPVSAFDEEIKVTGDTVAMSTPHEIEYTLIFHSDTMKVSE